MPSCRINHVSRHLFHGIDHRATPGRAPERECIGPAAKVDRNGCHPSVDRASQFVTATISAVQRLTGGYA
jgi:hypothetical protein